MSASSSHLLLGLAFVIGVAGCVPTTSTSGNGAAAPAAKTEGVYLATADNGITVPAVPPEKIPDEFERQVVEYETGEQPGTIVINPASKHLYFVLGKGKAIRYGIAVGKAGFEWHGIANVTQRKPWPTWTPPPEMIERKPELSKWEKGQPGGLTNPLGARALYLTTNGRDYGYRIHGTPDWWSIGKNASSGCIRMINQDVMDLYNRVPDGAKVIVLTRDGKVPSGLKLPPPAPKKKKEPEAIVAPAVATSTDAAAETLPASTAATSTPLAPVAPAATAATSVVLPAPSASTEAAAPTLSEPAAAPAALPAPTATTPSALPATPQPAAQPATEPAAPAATPAPACAVPLVNGLCPQN